MDETKPDDENKSSKKDKKAFNLTHEEQQKKDDFTNKEYFDKVKRLLQNSKRLKEKPARERSRVQAMIRKKESEIKELKKGKNKEALALANADKAFLKSALRALPFISMHISGDILKLETILATNIKMPYNVIADFELAPLPSQRSRGRNKDKDDKGKNNKGKNSNKETNKKKGQSTEKTEESKTGREIQNLRGIGPKRKTPVRQTKINPLIKSRSPNGYDDR